jgi:hypothetical protein
MIHKKLWGIDLYQKKHYYDEHTHRFTCGYYKGKKNHKCKCPKPLHILKRTLKEGIDILENYPVMIILNY